MVDERESEFGAEVHCTGRVRVEAVHGSWRGKIPDEEVHRAELSDDGERVKVEGFAGLYEVLLRDGAVRELDDGSDGARALQAEFEERAVDGRLRDFVAATSAARFDASTHALVDRYQLDLEAGEPRWAGRRVVAIASGDDVATVGRHWAACFSACGGYFGFVTPACRALVVVDLATRESRSIPLPFAGDRCAGVALDRGAGRAVLALRARARGGPRRARLAALSLEGPRVAWEIDAAFVPACVRADRGEGDRDVAWSPSPGRLEARSLDDGRVVRRIYAEFDEVSFDDAGRYALLVRQARRCVLRVELATGAVVGHDETPGEVLALAWAPGARRFAQSHAGGAVRVFDRASRALVCELELASKGHFDGAKGVAFVPGADVLACAYAVGGAGKYRAVLERFSLETGLSQGVSDVGGGSAAELVFSPDGSAFWLLGTHSEAGKSWLEAGLFRASDARELLSSGSGLRTKCAVGFATDRRDALDAVLARSTIGYVELLDLGSGQLRSSAKRGAQGLVVFGFTSSGLELVGRSERGEFVRTPTFGGDARVRPSSERVLHQWRPDTVHSIGDTLIALARESELGVDVRQLETGRKIGGVSIEGVSDAITRLALAPDESALLVGTRAGVVLELAIAPAR